MENGKLNGDIFVDLRKAFDLIYKYSVTQINTLPL